MADEVRAQDANDASQPLTFTADEAGSTVAMTATSGAPAVTLEYTTDSGQTWLPFIVGETVVTLSEIGAKVSIRAGAAGNERMSYSGNGDYYRTNQFYLTGSLSASGSVDSLLTQDPAAYAAGVQLSEGCYTRLFYNCTHLKQAPALPATTLAESCYTEMFSGCSSLTEAPYLPATSIPSYAYDSLFTGCTSLTYVKAEFLSLTDTHDWMGGVPAGGTIDLPLGCFIPRGTADGIPNGWAAVTRGTFDHEPDLLAFTAEEDGATVSFYWYGTSCKFLYTTDGVNWLGLINSNVVTLPVINSTFQISAQMKETGLTTIAGSSYAYAHFKFTGAVAASGNVNSLCNPNPSEEINLRRPSLYKDLFSECNTLTRPPDLPSTGLTEDCYLRMFYGCSSMKYAPALPATTLAPFCYARMFDSCSSLTDAPALPATTLANSCYHGMFSDCGKLTQAPDLPATTLANSCYSLMLAYCTALEHAPALPATTLDQGCYTNMFIGCTSLVNAPALPATTLVANCYRGMFEGCTSLNRLVVGFKAWAEDVSATLDWVRGVPQSGEFHCRRGLPRIYYDSHIPGPAPASN